ncbi:hypothetical protein [Streptomyces sp. WMMC940]|uniref:hypothetical protein n=1 Tax=Streptomyces sp. WMMC940 TaxID=3015153 RepID=UPI0022B5F508|nr:hypothetical protein [Streptomyces sp. WMMC940]MCZ7457322.1 hypothetical protein [Streptomyces sp. WMMC940]
MYDDGDGPPRPGGTREARARAAEVRVAFEGMLQIRRLTNTGAPDPESVPAPWERGRMVRAVALALEAAGIAPSAVDADSGQRVATGYRVGPVPDEPGTVTVEWLGPHGSGAAGEEEGALADCAGVLQRLGWDALLYRGRSRRRFLEVRPPHPQG